MGVIRCASVLLCVLLAGPAASEAQAPKAGDIAFEPYTLKTFDQQEHPAEMGHLWVCENRAHCSRLIQLAFVRLRSTAEKPAAPIVFLAGGPGVPGISMGRVPVYFQLFERLREVADVILLDQRGTGMSVPNLECSLEAPLPPDVFARYDKGVEGMMSSVRTCADHWRAQGVELRAYTTSASADDLSDLRRALGAERISLLGFSYGGELALDAVRRDGDHIERVVFASMRGPDQTMKLPSTYDFHLKRLSRLIAADPTVGPLVPDLAGLLRQILEKMDRQPLPITVNDRRAGHPVSLSVGSLGLQAVLQGAVSDGRAIPTLPALLYTLSQGDDSLLAPHIEGLYNSFRSGTSSMSVAMDCSSGWSAERESRVRREASRAMLRDVMDFRLRTDICEIVGSPDLGAEFRSAVWSTVPTLFLSGTLDAGAPPFQSEEVRWGFPNSVHIVVDNAGHESLPAAAVQSVVVDFFKGQDVSGRHVALPPPQFLSVEQAKAR
ncbi:MAG TPA: alpha/beta hydrolase [Candidatus Acidoferrales bacterium]|nr:alpha/beta hydrolase [Candidatus Acidoferrales bacterium]